MNKRKALQVLDELVREHAEAAVTGVGSTEKQEWHLHARDMIVAILGAEDDLAKQFGSLEWDTTYVHTHFESSFAKAGTIVKAARRRVATLWPDRATASAASATVVGPTPAVLAPAPLASPPASLKRTATRPPASSAAAPGPKPRPTAPPPGSRKRASAAKANAKSSPARPRVFVGSSVEQLDVANAIHGALQHDAEVTVWNQGFFTLSRTTLEDLEDETRTFDFAILVLGPDDIELKRNEIKPAVRDNVLFELGFFIGRVGRTRTFMFKPMKVDLHLPSDLLGQKAAEYDAKRSDKNWDASVAPACAEVRKAIKKLGPNLRAA